MDAVFQPARWITPTTIEREIAEIDLPLLHSKALDILQDVEQGTVDVTTQLRKVAQRLRYVVATREPLAASSDTDLQIATLWGAKGVTSDHVYVIGLCGEALPGERRDDYPGTEADHYEEQRRLFYVSLTRARKTLVLSRAERILRPLAARLGLGVESGRGPFADLAMCPFLRDIRMQLPQGVAGSSWSGC
jgi:hypothetical protein